MKAKKLTGFFLEKERIQAFNEDLRHAGWKENFPSFFSKSFLLGLVFALSVLAALLQTNLAPLYLTAFVFSAFLLGFLLKYFIFFYKTSARKKQIEGLVPDVLLQASIFSRQAPITEIMRYIAQADYGALSQEFAKAVTEIEKGAAAEEALTNLKKRAKSPSLDKAVNLLIQGYNSGADMGKVFKDAAEDLLESSAILRERAAALTIEKYTLLFAGAIIVPLILGTIASLVQGFDLSLFSFFGLDSGQRNDLLETALTAIQIYIIEYALLASIFVAYQESNLKNALIYAAVLLPVSLAAFYLIQLF